jgi:TolB-like protein
MACILSLLIGPPAASQTISKRLAVLEFNGGGIKGEVLDAFSDEVRGGAVDALAGRGVQVMTRENMLVLLKEMGKKDCSQGDCEVETARNIGADYVVSASVVMIDDEFVVTLKLHETKNGSLLATDRVNAKRKLDVLFKLRELGRKLVASNVSFRPQRGGAATGQPQRAGAPTSYREEQSLVRTAAAEAIVAFASNPPDAVVRVDDALLCTHTPCERLLELGAHSVTMEKERYSPSTGRFNVLPTGASVSLKLEPTFGWLSVQTVPAGVSVKINDEAARPAPIARQERDPGAYRIAVAEDCYLKVAETVQVQRGQEVAMKLELQPRMTRLSLTAWDKQDNALKGRIEIDGKAMGEVPFTGQIPFCSKQAVVATDRGTWSGPLELKKTGDNKMKVVANVEARDSSLQNRSMAAGAAYAGFAGTWTGLGRQANGSTWSIRMTLHSDTIVGAQGGEIEYPSLSCGGSLRVEKTGSTLVLREGITHGSGCVNGGQVQVSREGNALHWTWYYADGKLGASSMLSRAGQ